MVTKNLIIVQYTEQKPSRTFIKHDE